MLRVYLSLAVLAICAASNAQLAERIDEQLTGNLVQHEGLYKHLHQYPELSFKEFKTSEKLSDELEKLGFKMTRNVGGNGFVGLMQNGPGPVIMIRTDLDALPLEEKTGLSYASKVIMPDADGIQMPVMHACGHDMHMTVWLGTAKVLAVLKEDWRGTLMMVAQQAEEKSGGADAMIADGLFTRFPLPDYALAYHVSAELPAGTIGYRPGPFLAGVSSVDITVHGVGGHGALPHLAVDPVVLASRMVLAFQTIPSREINPVKPAIVTVGSIHGGTVHNIIPDELKMQLTVRYYNDDTYGHIISALQRIASGIAGSAGLPENLYPEVTPLGQTPPVVNDAKLTEEAVASFSSMLGPENVIEVEPVTVGEDFARYGRTDEKVPIAMFWLGTVNREKFRAHLDQETPLPGLHNPAFYPDFAPTYKTGVSAMAKAVIDLFNK
jgi:hippurate hydrolase